MPLSSRSYHERRKLAALHALKVLAMPPDERFDRITRLAARLFKVPTVLVSLVDRRQQGTRSYGLRLTEPSDFCLCSHAVEHDRLLVVPDTLDDPRFAINPLVVGEPHIRFYAGHPLIAPNGDRLGTLCLLDTKPRELDCQALASLRDVAVLVEEELYQRELADASVRLYQSELRYRSLFAQAQDGIMLIERGTARVLLANRALLRMLGYTAAEMTALSLYDFIAHDPAEIAANLEQCFVHNRPPRGERRYRRKNGSLVTVEISTSLLRYYGREAACAIVRELKERKPAIPASGEADGLFRSLFENAPHAVLVAGEGGRVRAANPTACQLLGRTADELAGLTLRDVFDINDRRTRDTLARAGTRGTTNGEILGIRRTGERFTVAASLVSVVDDHGVRNLSITLRDASAPIRSTERFRYHNWPVPAGLSATGLP